MKQKLLISIVIPTYNRARCIKRAIDSVLAQTCPNFEIIVVDGGSTDDTEEIVTGIKDDRIRYYKYDSHVTVGNTRNKGMELSNGKYILFLDSDDELLLKTALEEIIDKFESLPEDVGVLHYTCIDSVSKEPLSSFPFSEQKIDFRQMLKLKYVTGGFELLSTIRAEIGKEFNFYEKVNGLESIFWSKVYRKYYGYIVNKPLRLYNTEGEDRLMVKTREHWEFSGLAEGYLRLLEIIGEDLKEVNPKRYGVFLGTAGNYLGLACDKRGINLWHKSLKYRLNIKTIFKLIIFSILGPKLARFIYRKLRRVYIYFKIL